MDTLPHPPGVKRQRARPVWRLTRVKRWLGRNVVRRGRNSGLGDAAV
jgi:hypothetical protein